MEQLGFEIEKIDAGWFVFRLGNTEIWASDYWCHDGARQLLKLVSEVFSGEHQVGYAAFAAEPGSYVLELRGGEQAGAMLWYTEMEFFEWYPPSVAADCILTELPRHLRLDEALLRVEALDLYSFACAVGDGFSAYLPKNLRDRYTASWMAFPLEELVELRRSLGDDSPGLQKIVDRK